MAREVQLLDYRGRPIDRTIMRREVTEPSITGVRNILSSHPASQLTPARLAMLLRQAEQPGGADRYLELAEEMEERDLHYVGVLKTRKLQVSQIGITIEPADDSPEAEADAELVRTFFERDSIEDELFDILDAIGKGFAVTEIIWEMSESQWMPARLEWRLPKWFDFDQEGGRYLVRRPDQGGEWMELEPWKYVTHQVRAKSGLAIRGGMARIAAWGWFFKNVTIKDWVRFCEAYGMPIRIGKFHAGANEKDKEVLLTAVSYIAGDGAAIIPENMMIELISDTTVRGRSEIYKDLITYVDNQLSIAVLGQTLTTEAGERGARSLGEVHNLVRADIERADARQLAATLRRDIVIPMVQLNVGMRDAYPKVIIERPHVLETKVMVDAITQLVPLGLRPKKEDIAAQLGIEEGEDGDDDVLMPAAPPPGLGGPDADPGADPGRRDDAMARVILALARDGSSTQDAIDLAVARATGDWEPLLAPVIEPILAAARDHSGDVAAFRNRLPELFAHMEDQALAELLRNLDFSARISERGAPNA